jgi:hypothetical protein
MAQTMRQRRRFLWLILVVVGVNYLAQIPYWLHLYYIPHAAAPGAAGSLLLGLTLLWFVAGYALLAHGRTAGFWLLLAFLLTEVGFYAHGIFIRVTNGYPAFMNLQTHDPLLFVVFAIGYLNMFAGAYFLVYLALNRRSLIAAAPMPRSAPDVRRG